jgi:ribosomal protein L11 methyltransferase
LRVRAAGAEAARARLLELAPEGFEEVERDDGVEFVVYTDPAGEARLRERFGAVAAGPVAPDWEDRWRTFHRPVEAGGLWIGPPWEQQPHGSAAVVIEPGRAFGTGAHPTTRGCIELLARERRGSVLDAGCGSGVVSVAAARLGFGPVLAVDVDPVAVEATRENALRNYAQVEARCADVLHDVLPPADLLVANIDLSTVREALARRHAPRAITSGYLAGEHPAVSGWRVVDGLEVEGWSAHALSAS